MKTEEHPYYEEVKSLLERLVAGGATLDYVEDGFGAEPAETIDAALDVILSVDESNILLRTPEGEKRCLEIILGNDPGELVSDYTADSFLDRITEEHSEHWSAPCTTVNPPRPYYVVTCQDTQRVFVCQTGVWGNICEVFARSDDETVGDNAWLIADSLNLTQRLSP